MAEKYGTGLSIIHFDAHCDTWADDEENSLNHGTMFYKAIKNKIIDPKKSVQVGIRTWNEDFMDMNILDAPYVHNNSIDHIVEKIKHIVGDNLTYLTFDIDALDPAYAPGTGTPVSGGLTSHQALAIIRKLSNINFIGMDLVEVSPSYDHAEITAIAASHIVCDFISLMASSK